MSTRPDAARLAPICLAIAGLAFAPALAQNDTAPARPSFKPNRSDENWSAFTPPADNPEFWDPIKNIRLAEDVSLSLGGEARLRLEHWEDFAFAQPNDDTFLLGRVLLHADLRAGEHIRAFVQGKSAFIVDDRDLPGGSRTLDVDTLDLQQGFGDFMFNLNDDASRRVTIRLGRQELAFGRQRLVSHLPWANTLRSWDGARLIFNVEKWRIDAFYTRYAAVQKYEFNDWQFGPDFWGVYATGPIGEGESTPSIDLYYLGVDTRASAFNGDAGAETRHTIGSRLFGRFGSSGFAYDAEGAFQFGEVGDADVGAFMLAGELSYTPPECAWSPKFWIGADYASGDSTAGDGDVETFNQLFPLGHAFFGYQDFIGRQNLVSASIGASAKPLPALLLRAEVLSFWRADNDDALYNAGGGVLRAPGGSDESHAGIEFDLTAVYTLDAHTAIEGGYSHFFTGDFLDETGASEDVDWLYLQMTYRF
ncbi:MAG: alginate export family protein [Phycisphaerales bacterium]|nr:alginate export family protein [Phycisphaerales bacterium]